MPQRRNITGWRKNWYTIKSRSMMYRTSWIVWMWFWMSY
jgi:hypothetical protein